MKFSDVFSISLLFGLLHLGFAAESQDERLEVGSTISLEGHLWETLRSTVDEADLHEMKALLLQEPVSTDFQIRRVMHSLGSEHGMPYTWPGGGSSPEDRRFAGWHWDTVRRAKPAGR